MLIIPVMTCALLMPGLGFTPKEIRLTEFESEILVNATGREETLVADALCESRGLFLDEVDDCLDDCF